MNNKDKTHKDTALDIWADFCDQLKETGIEVLEQSFSDTELNQAEGLRYLTRLLRNGLEFKLEGAHTDYPQLLSYAHETIKMGADNPDIRYLNCNVSAQCCYKIRGTRGSVHQLNLSTHSGGYGDDSALLLSGALASEDLLVGDDGWIEILVSIEPQPGNWLPMSKESSLLIIRQIFLDRDKEQAASLSIHRLDSKDAIAHELTLNEVKQGLSDACASVKGTAELFTQWASTWLPHSNALPLADQQYCQDLGGDPQITYYHSHWAISHDDALVITLPRVPECRNWNVQINNVWMESLDYRYHRIHFNKHTATMNEDGSVTMILAHRDPKCSNWLHTTGHIDGTMCFRWVGIDADDIVHPQVTRCRLDDLAKL
ncbi:MAG: DUF1214 domain-containing protein [Pseudomonadota bacterium]